MTIIIGAVITTSGWVFLDWLRNRDAIAEAAREALQASRERDAMRRDIDELEKSISAMSQLMTKLETSDHWQWQSINKNQDQISYYHGPGSDSERRTIRDLDREERINNANGPPEYP